MMDFIVAMLAFFIGVMTVVVVLAALLALVAVVWAVREFYRSSREW
jgi:hypothetical protein